MAVSPVIRVAIAVAVGGAAARAHGTTMTWALPASGAFTEGSNWASGMAPGAADRSLFAVPGAFTVSFPSSVTNERFQVRQGAILFSMSGTTYELTLTSFPSTQIGIFGGDVGMLTISGGQVRTRDASIGVFASAQGQVTVQGAAASWLSQGNLTIGDAGLGSLTITTGGTASCLMSCKVANQIGSHGTLVVSGGGSSFTCLGPLIIGPGAGGAGVFRDAPTPQGTVQVSGGATLSAPTITVGGLGQLGGNTVSGAVTNSGVIAPGAPIGKLSLTGSFTQTMDGRTTIEILGRTAVTEYDQVQVTGPATLSGTLAIQVAQTFTPMVGDTFTVLTASGGVSGAFTTVTVTPPLQAGIPRVTVNGNNVVFKVFPRNANGDVDGNGVVNAVDLGLLLGAWGTSDPAADITGDGIVDSRDLAALLGGWGM